MDSEGLFITKPFDLANYFNDYFFVKVANLGRKCQQQTVSHHSHALKKLIMKEKHCKLTLSINNDKHPGIDNLDGKLLRMVTDSIASPIFNLSLEESLCPQAWKEANGTPNHARL